MSADLMSDTEDLDIDIGNYTLKDWVKPTVPPDTKRQFRQAPYLATIVKERLLGGTDSNTFVYNRIEDDEIRLLAIQPATSPSDKIECFLVTKKLKDVRNKYRALSYWWGSDRARYPVSIRNLKAKPKQKPLGEISEYRFIDIASLAQRRSKKPQFYVRSNLYSALQHLRREEEVVLMWVDAICIDQSPTPEGEEEKKKQVSKMAEIYNSAFSVCIWLGAGDAQTDTAMDFIREILNLQNFDDLLRDETKLSKWEALTELMRSRWFSRRWVVQEVALARKASLHCGGKIVHWDDFSDAVSLFITKLDRIRSIFPDPDVLGNVEAYGANILVTAINNLFRKSADGQIQDHLVGLETLVSSLLFFENSVEHDTIYSLMALARDTPERFRSLGTGTTDTSSNDLCPFPVEIDYRKEAVDVFVEFTQQCIESSQSLDIICRHWAPTVKHKRTGKEIPLPSWIMKVEDSPFGLPLDTLQGRRTGDSFVGCPFRGSRKTYNASGGTLAEHGFGPIDLDPGLPQTTGQSHVPKPGRTLIVKGFVLATVKKHSERIAKGVVPAEWLRIAGWSGGSESGKVPDKLWRTLVADRSPDGGNPPGWYHRACLHCLHDTTITDVNGDLTVSYSRRRPGSDIMMQFLRRAESVVWNRKFFLAGERKNELFGLVPRETQIGDLICILLGCTVPVVLHKQAVPGDDAEPRYVVIGESYVHGKMDGEAMWEFNQTGKELDLFILK